MVPGAEQTRCYLEGVLPRDAVYEAWFYIPEPAQIVGYWNLMFIQGLVGPDPSLWDVSLANSDDGGLHLFVLDHRAGMNLTPDPVAPVPIGTWFHVGFRLLRATDATGAIALYQNDVPILEQTGIVTDAYDVHQWYVGNWADGLMPAESTVYVDDVSVSAP
jgi:hypothetical protein